MILSWALTEVIRYSFYTSSLLSPSSPPPPLLNWLRYTTFYVLYPTGAGSEAFTAFVTLPKFGEWGRWDWDAAVRGVLFCVWWPGESFLCIEVRGRILMVFGWGTGLYVMYTHMMKQRRKVFGGTGRTLGGRPKQL